MPRPLSNDLRERLVRAVVNGLSCNAAAGKFDVSISAVVKLVQRWKVTGSYLPKQIGGYRKPVLAGHAECVRRLVDGTPDMTIAELQRRLAAHDIRVGQSSITRFLGHLEYTYKKNDARRRTRPPRR